MKGLESELEARLTYILNLDEKTRAQMKFKQDSLDYLELYSGQIKAVVERDKLETLKKKLKKLTSWEQPDMNKVQQKSAPRVTVIGTPDLPDGTLQLLDRGPKFALPNMPTGKKEKADMLKEVEVGLERYAYGSRYLDNMTEVDQTKKLIFLKKTRRL